MKLSEIKALIERYETDETLPESARKAVSEATFKRDEETGDICLCSKHACGAECTIPVWKKDVPYTPLGIAKQLERAILAAASESQKTKSWYEDETERKTP